MRHYLVVANQTLSQSALSELILQYAAAEPAEFHLLVPATHPHDNARWTATEATAMARARLALALSRLRGAGVDVQGEVGDPSPVLAINECLRHRSFDELILSTLPPGPSRWLRSGLPQRIGHMFDIPVTLVVAAPERVEAVS
ncbi:MAG TPA: hypothetical protein VI854_01130 [Acidimicrobiia bacterium]|nr:hypothetical protein [Acidimicrobiia bacterium]